jgi:superfamily I DNA/RNA helicase
MTWEDLSEEQRSAATYSGRHLLIRGWAGTGKTTALAARAAFLLDAGVPPEKILILSPTQAGCNAIINRARDLSKNASTLSGWTFLSWCQNLLDRYPGAFGIEGFSLSSSEEVVQFVPRGIDNVGMIPFERAIPRIYARYLTARVSLEDAIYWVYFRKNGNEERATMAMQFFPEVKKGFEEYIEFKIANKQYDEIDVQNIIAVTLQNSPEVLQFVSAEAEHILIDEAQDLNALQSEILSSLAPCCDLFCAGDETQSVHSSQGADWTTIRRFPEIIPDVEERTLTRNFRNTKENQDLALWILEKSPLDYRIDIPQARQAGQMPLLFCSPEKYNLYDAIAEDIKRNVNQYGYRYEDHLLIARESGDLFGPRISLTKRGIPCPGPETIRQKRWEGAHIRQLLTPLVRFADTDADPKALFSEVRKRFEESQDPQSYIFKERYQNEYDELQDLAGQARDVKHFFQLVEENRTVTKQTGYKKDHCIRIGTIQDAKAMEAEICYLWDVSHLHWPRRDEIYVPDLMEERRRLLSLGITRARSKVVILCPDQSSYLKRNRRQPFFLQEVGTRVELIDTFEDK